MYELNRTAARVIFKDLLGQANHFLITILVGLNGVRAGRITLDPEFSTSWNPKDVKASADRSRQFALDLALIRAVDALDAYMMRTRRRPLALTNDDFASRMDATGQKISRRLDVFSDFLKPLEAERAAFLRLAIDWRNQRVHSLAEDNLRSDDVKTIREQSEKLRNDFSGLGADEIIRNYQAGIGPNFKEAAAVIRLAHQTVEHFDRELLQGMDVINYIGESLYVLLAHDRSHSKVEASCQKIWGNQAKRQAKVLRTLRLVGVTETSKLSGREIPADFVDALLDMTPQSAFTFLSSVPQST